MRSGDIQERLIRRYEQLLRAEVANARRRPGGPRQPGVAAAVSRDVAATIAAARKAAGKAADRRPT
jgi:hypothetical protein